MYYGPKKGVAFTFTVVLVDAASRPAFKANPTIAAGDFQLSKDGGAFANLATLPTVSPASGVQVKVTLSAAEMNADYIMVKAQDAAGAEWDDNAWTVITQPNEVKDVYDELISGTYGLAVLKAYVDELETRLTAARAALLDNLDAAISSRSSHTPAQVADAVHDELLADHTIPGSAGEALAAAGGAADPLLNQVPGSYASGTAGAALGRVGSGQILVVNPVAQSGDIEIVKGDDYKAADNRALDWTDSEASWPDLTNATVMFYSGSFSKAGSVVTPTGANKKVRVELTADETATLLNSIIFAVVATLSNGDKVTLVRAHQTVLTGKPI